MLIRMLKSRGLLSVAMIMVLAGVVVLGYKIAKPTPKMRSYCALMPDSIGLFKGSAVSIMGVPVGSVTAIAPQGDSSRVDFDVPADRKLPTDVGATTVADSLIADRRLAIIGKEPTGAAWDSSKCITKTLTPKSLTETFTALSDLADELNGHGDPTQKNLIAGGISALDKSTTGTSAQINRIVHQLGSALDSPDAAIAHIGRLIDTLADLAHRANNGWGDVKSMLTRLTVEFNAVNTLAIPPIVDILEPFHDLLPPANDLTNMFAGPLLRSADSNPDLAQELATGVGGLREIVELLPVLARVFSNSIDPLTHHVSLTYAAPRVALPAANAEQVCTAINAMGPGRCAGGGDGLVNISLTQLVLGSVGAR